MIKTKKISWIAIIMLIFFIIGAYSIYTYGPYKTLNENLFAYDNDDSKYLRAAETLIITGKFTMHEPTQSTAFTMPAYIFLLTPFVYFLGQTRTVFAIKILQLFLQCFCLFLVFLTAKRILNKKVAYIAAVISCFYFADYYALNTVLTETLFKTIILITIYRLIVALQEPPRTRNYIFTIIPWALSIYVRPTAATLPILVLIMWLIKRYKVRDMVKYTAIAAALFIAFFAFWWARNFALFGEFIPLTFATGNPMLQGTYINYQQTPLETPYPIELPKKFGKVPFEELPTEIKNNITETAIAKYRIKNIMPQDKSAYIKWYTIGKTLELWKSPFVWREFLPHISATLMKREHLTILYLFFAGIIFAIFSKVKAEWWLLFLIPLYFTVIHLPLYAFARYAYPATPFVIILAAFALERIFLLLGKLFRVRKKA